jgi:hypothetical protein
VSCARALLRPRNARVVRLYTCAREPHSVACMGSLIVSYGLRYICNTRQRGCAHVARSMHDASTDLALCIVISNTIRCRLPTLRLRLRRVITCIHREEADPGIDAHSSSAASSTLNVSPMKCELCCESVGWYGRIFGAGFAGQHLGELQHCMGRWVVSLPEADVHAKRDEYKKLCATEDQRVYVSTWIFECASWSTVVLSFAHSIQLCLPTLGH